MSVQPRRGEPLPNAHLAVIDSRKLVDYALNPLHIVGKDKAAVFRRALGFDREHWETLRDRVLADLFLRPVASGPSEGYPTFGVFVFVDGLNGNRLWVSSAWAMRDGVPWLVSIRVAPKKDQTRLSATYPDAIPTAR